MLPTLLKSFHFRAIQLAIVMCLGTLFIPSLSKAQNAIVTENLLTGNPQSEWDIVGGGDVTIQGFSTDISVNKGNPISFKINTTTGGVSFSVKIYRLGYYAGNGARLVADLGSFSGTLQPACVTDATTGLVDCGNWSTSLSWNVPSTAVSGVYVAKLVRADNPTTGSHILFIVRNDGATSDVLFKTADATWQAYNNFGGYNFYFGSTSWPQGHAVRLSYNRPFTNRGGNPPNNVVGLDWFFNGDYPMLRWLERNGYDMTYTTCVDMARDATAITTSSHKILMSAAHDEYWSAEERNKFVNARNAGVHLAFFSGNEVYWKTRWANSTQGPVTPYRTLICYKEGDSPENSGCEYKCDPAASTWTGLWRTGTYYSGVDATQPENTLSGQMSWDEGYTNIQVPASVKTHRFWRNTAIATMPGATFDLPGHTLENEFSTEQPGYANTYPNGRMTLSQTAVGSLSHKMSMYKHSSGAYVFAAGTVQWSWGLDDTHDRFTASSVSVDMQQATLNLLADMSVQPGSKQAGLAAATASTDVTGPTVAISSPAGGTNYGQKTTVTITGTASDANMVSGVEVSVDGGTTWLPATGTTSWTYSWITPTSNGSYPIKVRGFDDTGNFTAAGGIATVTLNVTGAPAFSYPVTIYTSDPVGQTTINQGSPLTLGVKFRSSVSGFVTGLRFFKTSGNGGTHQGALYSANGVLLGQATYTSETATGWQSVTLPSPVSITANTTYIMVYYTDQGTYTSAFEGLKTPKANGPLTALANGTDGPNALFNFRSSMQMPTFSYGPWEYFLDLTFTNAVVTPVNYLYVRAKPQNSDVLVEWATTSESGNKGFEIERSTNGTSWTQAGFVASKNGAGRNDYGFLDKNLAPGKYFYRLKQIDLDGKFAYSDILPVSIDAGPGQFALGQNQPNPATGHTLISYTLPTDGPVKLAVFDQYGREVLNLADGQQQAGTYRVNADLSRLSPGVYFYRLMAAGRTEVRKMIIMN